MNTAVQRQSLTEHKIEIPEDYSEPDELVSINHPLFKKGTIIMKSLIKTIAMTTLTTGVLLSSSLLLAAEPIKKYPTIKPGMAKPGVVFGIKKNPLPDFWILNVGNKHNSGPKGILRYGSCKNDIRVIVKNTGASYQYGDELTSNTLNPVTVKGGQILVQLQKLQNNKVISSENQFIGALGKNQHVNVDFNHKAPGHYPNKGTYTMRATVIPCSQGASTPNCNTIPEEDTQNNSFGVNWTVTSACPST